MIYKLPLKADELVGLYAAKIVVYLFLGEAICVVSHVPSLQVFALLFMYGMLLRLTDKIAIEQFTAEDEE